MLQYFLILIAFTAMHCRTTTSLRWAPRRQQMSPADHMTTPYLDVSIKVQTHLRVPPAGFAEMI